jgi:hypothetical protein
MSPFEVGYYIKSVPRAHLPQSLHQIVAGKQMATVQQPPSAGRKRRRTEEKLQLEPLEMVPQAGLPKLSDLMVSDTELVPQLWQQLQLQQQQQSMHGMAFRTGAPAAARNVTHNFPLPQSSGGGCDVPSCSSCDYKALYERSQQENTTLRLKLQYMATECRRILLEQNDVESSVLSLKRVCEAVEDDSDASVAAAAASTMDTDDCSAYTYGEISSNAADVASERSSDDEGATTDDSWSTASAAYGSSNNSSSSSLL